MTIRDTMFIYLYFGKTFLLLVPTRKVPLPHVVVGPTSECKFSGFISRGGYTTFPKSLKYIRSGFNGENVSL